ncbi:LacI family DNA-binding transcriptional regulator [Pantoea sp.]|uniref:LacI family DNA-binding transcriptional regulator n=1 Tax=Pantoea sp. TaxID=69393 RepID=UPI0028A7894D|nr:LacI family DNA-binding transcriptional regulator [Pantoea sp.]
MTLRRKKHLSVLMNNQKTSEVKPTVRRKSVRFIEIADKAGVSVATVDRVLNERGSVSDAARAKVLKAAKELAVPRTLPSFRHRQCNLMVVLPRSKKPFWERIDLAFRNAVKCLPKNIVLHRVFLEDDNEDALISALQNPLFKRDGVIIAAVISDKVKHCLDAVMKQGKHVVTFITDISSLPPHPFCGIDNCAAGRTAGYLMGRAFSDAKRILVLQGNDWYQAHVERVAGFKEVFQSLHPNADITVKITRERPEISRIAILEALSKGHLDGVYDTGNSSSSIAYHIRKQASPPCWIGHENDVEHTSLLKEGLLEFVLDQDPDGQVQAALAHMLRLCNVSEYQLAIPKIELRVYCRHNLPTESSSDAYIKPF